MASRNRTRPLDEKMRNNIGDLLFRYQEPLQIRSSTRASTCQMSCPFCFSKLNLPLTDKKRSEGTIMSGSIICSGLRTYEKRDGGSSLVWGPIRRETGKSSSHCSLCSSPSKERREQTNKQIINNIHADLRRFFQVFVFFVFQSIQLFIFVPVCW